MNSQPSSSSMLFTSRESNIVTSGRIDAAFIRGPITTGRYSTKLWPRSLHILNNVIFEAERTCVLGNVSNYPVHEPILSGSNGLRAFPSQLNFDVIITCFNYNIKKLIMMQKDHRPLETLQLYAWTGK